MLKKIWFDHKPKTTFATKYIQSTASQDLAWMVKQPFHTLIVDILQTQEDILSQCTPNCRNEIRKGSKIGLDFYAGPAKQADVDFIHHFLSKKKLGGFNHKYLGDQHVVICIVSLHGVRLATHLYVAPSHTSRARLVYSAVADPVCITTQAEVLPQRLIGIANRFLHFSAMLHFKARGLKVYDFGGMGPDESDPKIKGINEFKRSFGGSLIAEYNYTPLWVYGIERILRRLLGCLRQFRQDTSIH